MISQNYARLPAVGTGHGRWRLGLPGWQVVDRPAPDLSLSVMMIAPLAVGSFEGLPRHSSGSRIGVNPLDYHGRSTVIAENALGLAAAMPVLTAAYSACLWAGVRLAGSPVPFGTAFRAFAPALLPIALAYHFAHYLPGLLIDLQSVPIVATDPLGTGADLLGLGPRHVSSGVFNRLDTVRVIFGLMAGGVVAGHAVAILLSHVIALDLFGSSRQAALSQMPIAGFHDRLHPVRALAAGKPAGRIGRDPGGWRGNSRHGRRTFTVGE